MERKEVFAKATELGIEYKKNISTEALLTLIEEAEFAAKADGYEKPVVDEPEEANAPASLNDKARALNKDGVKKGLGVRMDANRLIRCIIVPLDEDMRDIQSEMYSVGTSDTGFIKKVIKFNEETIEPLAVIKHLKGKTMLMQVDVGNGKAHHKQVSAFNISILPDYTAKEIQDLMAKNRASK